MIPAIKAEFRKLLTVRSTYVISTIAVLITGVLVSFYIEGVWGKSGSAAGRVTDAALSELAMNTIATTYIFVAIVAILQVVHEYRHNTILYTLTAINSRTKAFLAKVTALFSYAIVFTLLALGISLGLYLLGIAIRGVDLPTQTIDWMGIIGRGLFLALAFCSIGIILSYLSRNIALAIVALFIIPSTFESLITLLIKEDSKYLLFNALGRIAVGGPVDPSMLSLSGAVFTVLAYLTIGGLVTWAVFLKRDAN